MGINFLRRLTKLEKIELVNYRMLSREVEQFREQLERFEASLFSPNGQRFTSTPHSSNPHGSTMELAVCRHIELQELYMKRLAEKNAQLLIIEQAIASLEDPAQRVIMRDRYVLGWSWRRICATLASEGYSERQVFRLHGYALLKLKEYPQQK